MKIATWNTERLKHHKSLDEIISACNQTQADILVLTETDKRIYPDYRYSFQTPTPPDIKLPSYEQPLNYELTEHRIAIFTNYKPVREYATFDKYTALCIELETEKGNLLVYGTIIGVLGNRHPSFRGDLGKQLDDYKRLSTDGSQLCVCGDFNCSFADNYYFTKEGRELLLRSFAENQMELLTAGVPSCIDHIAVSKRFIAGEKIQIDEWNLDKTLSDHKGISVEYL